MAIVPTNAQRIRRLPWWYAASMLDNVRVSLIFGPVLILFLDALSLNKARIGLILSLPLFFQTLAIFAVPLVEKIGYKRSCLIFFTIRAGVWYCFLCTSFIAARFGNDGTFLLVGFVMLIFSISQMLGLTASGPWSQEFLPTNIRSKAFALNTFLYNMVVLAGTWFAGFWIARSSGISAFVFLITLGTTVGLVSVSCNLFLPGGEKIKRKNHSKEHLVNMFDAFKDRDFVRLLAGYAVFILIVQGMISFVPLFMKDIVGIDSGRVVYLTVWTTAGTVLAVYFWGWAADRFGGKPVLLTGMMFFMIMPVLWYIIPRHQDRTSFFAAVAVSFIGGILSVAYLIGIDRYLFLTAFPPDKKTTYYSVWFAWTGFFAGLGPMITGIVLKHLNWLDHSDISFMHIRLDSFLPVFAAHIVLPATAIYILRNIKADSETTARQFVGQLFQSLPYGLFGSISSIVRYRLAGQEQQRIVTTRGLGRLDSPFNTDELIEAIKDPSFDVRYEAVIAMAMRKSNQRIFSALLDVLNGVDIELSAAAAPGLWDKSAAKRLYLRFENSSVLLYRILRARSARALAGLGDTEIAPQLLKLFTSETDLALKTAYASALGTLGYLPALEHILKLLSEAQSETFRGELALAVAKIIGSEQTYIKLFRSAQSDWSTTISNAILKLKKPMTRLKLDPALIDGVAACADSFAADKYGLGVELLWPILDSMPQSQIDSEYRKVFIECGKRLEQFGIARREYILLAIHTCDVWIRARITMNKKAQNSATS